MANYEENIIPQTAISGEAPKSRVDSWSGQHTSSILVAILFVVVFLGLVTYICVKDHYETVIITGLFSLLSSLIGFFIGSQTTKK